MKKVHVLLIVFCALFIALLLSLMDNVSSYESFSSLKTKSGVEVHVVGHLVKEKEVVYQPEKNANNFSFYMRDTTGVESKVLYHQAKPQDFEKSEKIGVVGKLEDRYFEASQILMKCPSKYVKEEEL